MTAADLAATLRALADENGAKARELAALNHPHLAAWYQGQREAYLKVFAMVEGVTDERLLPEQAHQTKERRCGIWSCTAAKATTSRFC